MWPQHVAAVQLFLAAATQWRTVPLTSVAGSRVLWIGLDYSAARVAVDALSMPLTPVLWAEFMIIERAAIAALNGDDR